MLIKRFIIFALWAASTAAIGEPAPWYWWVSQLDGSRACNQTSLGPGWLREPTPFRDGLCRVRLYR